MLSSCDDTPVFEQRLEVQIMSIGLSAGTPGSTMSDNAENSSEDQNGASLERLHGEYTDAARRLDRLNLPMGQMDRRVSLLIICGLKSREIAEVLSVTERHVRLRRQGLRKRLGIPRNVWMRAFLESMIGKCDDIDERAS